MTKTDAFEAEVLKLCTGQATGIYTTTPIAPYISLWNTSPTDITTTGTTGEVTGGSYARVDASNKFGAPALDVGVMTCKNNAIITFPTATGDWGSVVAFGIHAGATGTLLRYGAVTKTIQNGDTASFAVGALSLTEE